MKASRRIMVLGETGRLTDEKAKGDLIAEGAEKLAKMDYSKYLEGIGQVSEALAETLGEEETSNVLTRISGLGPIKELSQEDRRKLIDTYSINMKQAAKIEDYAGMISHLQNKWQLFGFDSTDLSFVSDEFAKLMKRGRARFALTELEKLNTLYGGSDIEVKIGMTLQAFKDLAKAPVRDRDHFNSIIEAASRLFDDLVSSIDNCEQKICEELMTSQAVADLCLTTVTSSTKLMDSYIKRPGKSVSAATAYPLLHDAAKPLISSALKVLKRNGDEKTVKSVKNALNKMRGQSSAKDEMVKEAEAYFGKP